MNAKQRGKLVDALLGCPSVSNRNTRNTLVGNLYEDIQRNIQRSDADREDVTNIVRTCLNYSNGLEEFIAVVRRYEGTSIPMEAVDSLILDIYDLDVLPSARPMHIQLLSTISDIEVPSDELKQVYRSILPEGVEESAEPLGLFAITSHLWNLSLRPEGQRKDRAYPVIDWIEELARRTADSGLATGLRNWANRVAPELDQQARQRQRPGQPAVAAETQGQMELDLRLTILASVLSFLYPTVEDSGEIVAKSRLNPVNIDFRDNAFRNWLNILNEARERARVRAIIDTALTDHAGNEWLRLASREQELEETRRETVEAVRAVKSPQVDMPRGLRPIDPLDPTWLVPVAFLERGAQVARSVARISPEGFTATGFLVDDNLLITAGNVLPDVETAKQTVVQFNFQRTLEGLYAPTEDFRLAPDEAFLTSSDGNWTVVRVAGNPNERWGAIPLARANPGVGDPVAIVQHTAGGPKTLAYFGCLVVFVGGGQVHYLASTMGGSSGAPVFDSAWNVIAMHHLGSPLREPGSTELHRRKGGIHINVIIDALVEAGLHSGS